MLVTFSCPAYANITMFGDVAETLLKMMGHSGTVPGALLAEDVPAARARLEAALARHAPEPPPDASADEEDGEPPVSLRQRAYPLLEMLEAAEKEECEVMWK